MLSFELNLTYQEANTPDQHHFLMPIFCPSFTTELFAFPSSYWNSFRDFSALSYNKGSFG